MDIANLFNILAAYTDFLLDFLSFRGMDKYAGLQKISEQLVAFAVVGVSIAYIVSLAKGIPQYQRSKPSGQQAPSSMTTSDKEEASPKKLEASEIFRFVLLSFVGALSVHWIFELYSHIFGSFGMGSVRDTMNATIAYNAGYHPFKALIARVQEYGKGLPKRVPGRHLASSVIQIVSNFLDVAFLAYFFYALGAVYKVSVKSLILPMLFDVAVIIIVIIGGIIGWYFLNRPGSSGKNGKRPDDK